MEIQGSVALVTGAGRRIGREIALALARNGAGIVIHYHRSRREAEALLRVIRDGGGEAHLAPFDFSAAGGNVGPAVRKFSETVLRKTGRVDILVNNASIFYPTPLAKIRDKDWDEFLTVNLKVPFFLAREFGMRMLALKKGKIINLIDAALPRPKKDYLAYSISKAALAEATLGLAKNLAPHVQVLSIAPGPILPPAAAASGRKAEALRGTLLKRFGDPGDIAETVLFFVGKNDFITGATITVDGGMSLK
jgi:NAD(P)-dependent dehydrogenase (short-subunit alcohol dehydrogenase family)